MKLNLGSGDKPLDGYLNIDRKMGGQAGTQIQWRDGAKCRTFHDGEVDEVRASHILEHFGFEQTADVLAEWVRVLKPGGVLKIAVPNFNWIIANRDNPLAEPYLMGGHLDENDRHGAIFTEAKLRGLMKSAGLVDIQPWVSETNDCASLPVSLNLQGTKPDPAVVKPRLQIPPLIAVMSCGRFGFTDFWENVYRVLGPMGIQIATHNGVFWEQAMERLMDRAITSGFEWVLTLDHDTLFTKKDVTDLLRLMHDHPEADAIAPLQAKRAADEVLAGIMRDGEPDPELKTGESPLVKVDTAHFGLTLIRTKSLMKLRHPWFMAQPNEYGRWDDGRQDADIAFWWKWKEAGNSLYIAHRVAVGHVQELCTWPTEDGGLMHEYVGKFHMEGKPEGVRK